MPQALAQCIYLLKDICKLAQNVFLQAMECGNTARKRKYMGFRQKKDKFIHIKYALDPLVSKERGRCLASGSICIVTVKILRVCLISCRGKKQNPLCLCAYIPPCVYF